MEIGNFRKTCKTHFETSGDRGGIKRNLGMDFPSFSTLPKLRYVFKLSSRIESFGNEIFVKLKQQSKVNISVTLDVHRTLINVLNNSVWGIIFVHTSFGCGIGDDIWKDRIQCNCFKTFTVFAVSSNF